MIGRTVSHYRVLDKLGQGGMGEVFLALDTSLDRKVALKFLPPGLQGDEVARQRFLREAKSAAAIDHPFICNIHEVGKTEGKNFIAMEYIEGETLKDRMMRAPLPLQEALSIADEIAQALGKAHQQNIVHRDLKPSNIMLTPEGHAKVMDFGLAKRVIATEEVAQETPTDLTVAGSTVGTIPYMSPEQILSQEVDQRSDLFSFGIILYEMVGGKHPFWKGTSLATSHSILSHTPPAIPGGSDLLSRRLRATLQKALQKKPELRYSSSSELRKDIHDCLVVSIAPESGSRFFRDRRIVAASIALILGLTAVAAWLWQQNHRVHWVHTVALPQISQMIDRDRLYAALRLIKEARLVLPEDPELERLFSQVSVPMSIETSPPGADIYLRDYSSQTQEWEFLGVSPVPRVYLPFAAVRWRIARAGYEPLEAASSSVASGVIRFRLEAEGFRKPGMVPVPGGFFTLGGKRVELEDYRLDRFEVSNEEYKKFFDSGGYETPEYWEQSFVAEGGPLSWEEAVRKMVDRTGRTGPAGWELGTYLEGRSQYPVSGVSWYEADAYCRFAGKQLPTVYHWWKAAGLGRDIRSPIVRLSNFEGKEPAPVGTFQGLSPFGSYDMAGNVKEWCWNAAVAGRYVLGGAWNEAPYMFNEDESRDPWQREENLGFRCAEFKEADPLLGPIEAIFRDYSREEPVSDEVFEVFRSLYSYDRAELNSEVESNTEELHWWLERVTMDAAYGGERLILLLFLPKEVPPPYQGVVYAPGIDALWMESSRDLGFEMSMLDFIVKSGRAVIFPIYKGTYERRLRNRGSNAYRDMVIQWPKDLGRSLDYLEERPDIDSERLAYYGLSFGASLGLILTALEDRFRASVLVAGGLDSSRPPREVEKFHFLPRIHTPTLMLAGRIDFIYPVETSLEPMNRLLGTPEKDKKLVLFDSGHIVPRLPMIKEILDWLDQYLGSVQRTREVPGRELEEATSPVREPVPD